jgi:hypothetical protein
MRSSISSKLKTSGSDLFNFGASTRRWDLFCDLFQKAVFIKAAQAADDPRL